MTQADELLKYKELLESGAITQKEFDEMKMKILGTQQLPKQDNTTSNVNVSNSSVSHDYTYDNVKNAFDNEFKPRKGLRTAGIILGVGAVIYMILAVTMGLYLIGMGVFFGILAFMFLKLSKVPKEYVHIGKNDTGLKKGLFVVICIILGFVIVGMTFSTTDGDKLKDINSNSKASTNAENDNKAKKTKDEPTIELANDFERALYDAVNDNKGTALKIYIEEPTEENNQLHAECVELTCENNEEVVQGILNKLVEAQKADGSGTAVCVFVKESKDSTENLIAVYIHTDGSIITVSESPNYKSARNIWITNQFSVWDGSHTELTKLIKSNLNDEKSYEHIKTTYRNIKTQADADEVNKVLSDAKYTAQVEIGDLFIMTEFSAKNAFNATIKNTAFGIASYNNNTIVLVAIE